MNVLIVYDSEFGNTEKLARALGEKLAVGGTAEVISVRAGLPDLSGVELLLVGGPTQVHGVSPKLREALDALPAHALRNVQAAAFDTRIPGMKLLTGSAANGIAHRLEQKGAQVLEPHESFLVLGKEGPLADGELERACDWALAIREQALESIIAAI
jgi:flavorubredoxin